MGTEVICDAHVGNLFDCFKDWRICCYGCWCTARLYAENAVQITGSNYDDAFYTYMNSGEDACPWTSVTATRARHGSIFRDPTRPDPIVTQPDPTRPDVIITQRDPTRPDPSTAKPDPTRPDPS